MEAHLSKEEEEGNKRNGKGTKTLKSSLGEVTYRRLRTATAALSQLVKKCQRILADSLEEKIIGRTGA